MGTKKQEDLKKVIFKDTKRTRTTADLSPDINLSLLENMGMKFKFDKSKDYFRKSSKEIKLLKEEKEKARLNEDHLITRREKIAFVTALMEKVTDAQINTLYSQMEEFVGDAGTV